MSGTFTISVAAADQPQTSPVIIIGNDINKFGNWGPPGRRVAQALLMDINENKNKKQKKEVKKLKRLTLSLVMSFAFMVCVAPCAFSLSVGDPVAPNSDILQVTFNSALLVPPDTTNPQIRTIVEVPGEQVTEEIDFTIANTDASGNRRT